MATIIKCVCPIPLGSDDCDIQTGIAELYYTPSQNIETIVFVASSSTCCSEGEIASFALTAAAPSGLLQPISFVKQDDDTGAVFEFSTDYEAGNKIRNATFTFQSNSSNPDEECTLDSMVGNQVAFLYKGKNDRWKFVNWRGGLRVTNYSGSSNLSYSTITLGGRANDKALYVSYTDSNAWADVHLVPVSSDPINGLINA